MLGKSTVEGFTLIELMIVITIIGILLAIALPAYQDYLKRSRIFEGLQLSTPAKTLIASSVATRDDLKRAAVTWNKQASSTGANSKYVSSVKIDKTTGLITITYNPTAVGVAATENTLTLTPWIRSGSANAGQSLASALSDGKSGTLDWGCASNTKATAEASGITVLADGTMESKFAPSQCR